MAKKPSVVYVKVDKDPEKIEAALKAATEALFSINGDISIEKYIEECGHKMLYLSFDGNHDEINFNQFKLEPDSTVLTYEEFIEWLKD